MSAKRLHPERDLQKQVADLLDSMPTVGPLGWFHCPNEGRRSPVTGALLKRLGMKAGYPDVRIERPNATCPHGAAIELKRPGGKRTPAQEEWCSALVSYCVRYDVCHSLDDVIAALRRWGYLR